MLVELLLNFGRQPAHGAVIEITGQSLRFLRRAAGERAERVLAQRPSECLGDVIGVVGSKPPHELQDEERRRLGRELKKGSAAFL